MRPRTCRAQAQIWRWLQRISAPCPPTLRRAGRSAKPSRDKCYGGQEPRGRKIVALVTIIRVVTNLAVVFAGNFVRAFSWSVLPVSAAQQSSVFGPANFGRWDALCGTEDGQRSGGVGEEGALSDADGDVPQKSP